MNNRGLSTLINCLEALGNAEGDHQFHSVTPVPVLPCSVPVSPCCDGISKLWFAFRGHWAALRAASPFCQNIPAWTAPAVFYHNFKLVDIKALSAEIPGSTADFQICSLALTLAQANAYLGCFASV